MLWRLQNGEIDGIAPKLVTMMIGTNNIKRDEPTDIALGIKAIIAELRQRLPASKIVVFPIFPRNHTRTEGDFEAVKEVNKLLPALADGKQVFHVDIGQNFMDDRGQPTPELYGRDLLHLSNDGYAVWLKALQPILGEAGLKAKDDKPEARAVKKKSEDPFRDPFANPADDPALPRVLIIGDSISIGYTAAVRNLLSGKANVHRVKGNCRYSAFGVQHIDEWLGKGDWDLIHFNFGLWDWYGWSQDPKATPESYKANLDQIVTKLKATRAKLIFALTTPPCIGPDRKMKIIITEERAKEFNDAALTVMKQHAVEINDLYAPIAGRRSQYQLGTNNVHYTDEGKSLQAKQVAKVIEAGLKTGPLAAGVDPTVGRERFPAMQTTGEDGKRSRPTERDKIQEHSIIRLWPIEQVGGEQNRLKDVYRDRRGRKQLCGVLDPHMTVHPAKSDKPTPAIVYCPGGAYRILAIPTAETIKQWHELGITVFVLKYTIPNNLDAAFRDIQRAIRLVRHEAERWNVDPNNIGVFGNSAGGHLSARLTQNYSEKSYEPIDDADKESCEPNFAILQCAAYFQGRKMDKDFDAERFHMKNKVAPTFLTYAKDDKFCKGGIEYEKRLREAGGTIQLKLFDKGGHGMGGCDWFPVAAEWIRGQLGTTIE
ncbi:MAG: alpha/beta hydrolase fold domain-containing protein [Verrucomicrobia bacterium]|nr:alpha/beta hydrolase fold domain-containing protein [Verrucomicrobiota bacterium]